MHELESLPGGSFINLPPANNRDGLNVV